MRPHFLWTGLLLAASLQAQARPIAPAPSALFAPAEPVGSANTAGRRPGVSILKGGGLGAGVGILVGAAIGAVQASVHPCSCDDPGLEPFTYGVLGGIIGFVVGASKADERLQKAHGEVGPHDPATPVTEDGTPLVADSTRLVGRDPHGVRGGIAGALMGGAVGYAIPHLVHSFQHSGGYPASGGGGDGGPSALAVGVGTISGAISGYLIAALLSRH
jgi:hypothetical protein